MSVKRKINKAYSNLAALFQYPEINKALNEHYDIYFFFNSWELGGAERVHLQILNLFKNKKVLCFITDEPNNDGFKNEFMESCTTVIKLGRWAAKGSYARHMTTRISAAINKQGNSVVVSCNSAFLYRMIDRFTSHVKVIDIIHNFSDGQEGAEWFSIPYIARINHRVVLGNRIKTQLKDLYRLKNVNEDLLERVKIIPNTVKLNAKFPSKNYEEPLNVIFVARNAKEKRAGLFLEIAEQLMPLINAKFSMIGDFESFADTVTVNTSILGSISDQKLLEEIYQKAHILLLTSHREGMPLVVFEAMANAVVPICTNVGELSTYIQPQKNNGFLIDNKNSNTIVNDFVEKILFLNKNRDQLKEHSVNAYETVKSSLNQDLFAKAYKDLILGQ